MSPPLDCVIYPTNLNLYSKCVFLSHASLLGELQLSDTDVRGICSMHCLATDTLSSWYHDSGHSGISVGHCIWGPCSVEYMVEHVWHREDCSHVQPWCLLDVSTSQRWWASAFTSRPKQGISTWWICHRKPLLRVISSLWVFLKPTLIRTALPSTILFWQIISAFGGYITVSLS